MEFLIFYLLLGFFTLGLGWAVTVVFFRNPTSNDEDKDEEGSREKAKGNKNGKGPIEAKKGPKVKAKVRNQGSESSFEHPWLATSLKGHGEDITDLNWSSNSKFVASCAGDRTVLVWLAKDLTSKDHKSIRVNIPFDSAKKVVWSPDSKAFIISRAEEQLLEVFKLGKKPDGSVGNITSVLKFNQAHKADIVGLGIACTGSFLMSCSVDGAMIIWSLKGVVMEQINVMDKKVNAAKISACGRFIAVCGQQLDALLYEVNYSPTNQFQGLALKWKLKDHDSEVYDLDMNADGSKIATITQSGYWRLFDTTGNRVTLVSEGSLEKVTDKGVKSTVALSPDCRIIAVGNSNGIHIFSTKKACLDVSPLSWKLHDIGNTSVLLFSTDNKLLAAGCGRVIRIFYNVCGYNAAVEDLNHQIQDSTTSTALKTRLAKDLEALQKEMTALNMEKFSI